MFETGIFIFACPNCCTQKCCVELSRCGMVKFALPRKLELRHLFVWLSQYLANIAPSVWCLCCVMICAVFCEYLHFFFTDCEIVTLHGGPAPSNFKRAARRLQQRGRGKVGEGERAGGRGANETGRVFVGSHFWFVTQFRTLLVAYHAPVACCVGSDCGPRRESFPAYVTNLAERPESSMWAHRRGPTAHVQDLDNLVPMSHLWRANITIFWICLL